MVLDELYDIEENQAIDQHDDRELIESFDLLGEDWFKTLEDSIKTPRLCIYAVMHDPTLLRYIPEEFKTYSFCLFCVCGNWRALKYVSKANLCDAIIMEAIQQSSFAIQMIPKKYRTVKLYNTIAKLDPHAIKYMPKDELVEAVYESAICTDPGVLFHTPNKQRTVKWKFLADSAHFLYQEEEMVE